MYVRIVLGEYQLSYISSHEQILNPARMYMVSYISNHEQTLNPARM